MLRRGRPRAGRRRGVDDPRAARDAEAGALVPARRPARATTRRSAGGSPTRAWRSCTAPTRWARRRRTSPQRYGVARDDAGRVRAREPPPRRSPPQEAGRFDEEIVPVPVPQPKGDPVTVHSDEGPRADTTLEKLGRAAAGVPRGRHGDRRQLLADQRRRRVPGAGDPRSARASWAASRSRGSSPPAPPASTRATWASARSRPRARRWRAPAWTIDDIDLVELNEAFASQVLACARELGHRPRRG